MKTYKNFTIKSNWQASIYGHKHIVAILLVSFLLNIHGIWWGLPTISGYSWAPDEISPLRVYKGLEQYFSNGWFERYPPFHFYLLSIIYSPFIFLSLLNIIDIRSNDIVSLLFLVSRLLNVFMGMSIVFLVYLCGLILKDKNTGIFSALITTIVLPLNYYAKIGNLDVPYIFWLMLSIVFLISITKNNALRNYIFFVIFATLSVCTKDQAYGFYMFVPIFIYVEYKIKKKSYNAATERANKLHKIILRNSSVALVVGTFLFFLIHNIIFNFTGFISHIQHIVGPASKNYRIYENNLSGHLRMLVQTFEHLIFALGIPFFLICVAGMILTFFQKNKNHVMLLLFSLIISYYITFISIIGYNYLRFLIPVAIILSLYGGNLLSFFISRHKKFTKKCIPFFIILVFYSLYRCFCINLLMTNDSRYTAEAWINRNVSINKSIVGLGTKIYLPRIKNNNFKTTFVPSSIFMENVKPDYIVTTSAYGIDRYKKKREELKIYKDLENGKKGYTEVFKYKYESKWNTIDISGLITNLDKINPEIKIHKNSEK